MNTERHKAECGCTVIVVGGRFGEKPATKIVYCARHEAADEMYEALKNEMAYWGSPPVDKWSYDSVREDNWKASQAALALAERDKE